MREQLRTSYLSIAWKVVGILGAAGVVVLVTGLLLPSEWEARRSVVIEAPPDSVFPYLAAPGRWDAWTLWGDVASTFEGPRSGVGATRLWDDDYVGDGRFTITESRPAVELAYRVEVQGGSMITRGHFRLAPVVGGTRVEWREGGDLGRNPLMGYAARSMGRVQGIELERALARLEGLLEDGAVPDSLRLAPPAPR